MKRILIVAAHPDDEVLGCGAAAARLAGEGAEIFTLILGEGVTARDGVEDPAGAKARLEAEAREANRILGVKELFRAAFPDNRFDTVPLLEVVKEVERVKTLVAPDTVFTHFADDLNVDHQVTNQAVLTATRPLPGETVKTVYAFDVLSSTEWNYPLAFAPDTYMEVSAALEAKKRAMAAYASEARPFPHPRSPEGIDLAARFWGMRTGLEAAEPFQTLRRLV